MNRFGTLFSFTSWGESHGPAIGCVVDGCPAGIPLSEADIQPYLDARRPAQSRFTTQRKEPDVVKILSGVFEGKSTGHPISLIIENVDAKSKDYGEIAQSYRPGHADYTYDQKYGIRDYRGGGRSSARETAMRVAAGAIARKVLNAGLTPHRLSPPSPQGEGSEALPLGRGLGEGPGVSIRGALVQLGEMKIDRAKWDWKAVNTNPFWCPDATAATEWERYLDGIRKDGSSVGAVIEVVAEGVPVGLGEPVYSKLDAKLAEAMMSINAVKGVEIGDGFAAAALRGEQNADEMRMTDGKVQFGSNHAGGVLGGISSGQPVVVRFAVKPTSSILTPVPTINAAGENTEITTKGRHDPCVGIRAVPVGEAMMACVLADLLLQHRARML